MPPPNSQPTSTVPVKSLRDWKPDDNLRRSIDKINEVPVTNAQQIGMQILAQQTAGGGRR